MQRDAHQTTLARLFDIRHHKQRFRPQRASLKDAHTTGTLGEDHATVRRPNNGPRHLKSTNHLFNFETGAGLRRTLDLARPTPRGWLTASKTKRYQQRYKRESFH